MKADRIRRHKYGFFRISFFLVTILFLSVALVPFLSSGGWWFIAILGLIYPFLLLLEIIFLIIWAVKKSKLVFISALALLLNWQQLSVILAIKGTTASVSIKEEKSLRVLSWNVSRWDERNKEKRGGQSYRQLMFDYIEYLNADVLCLQEFFECTDPKYFEANIPALQKLGFTYFHFFPIVKIFQDKFQHGLAIFSRHPIVDTGSYSNYARIHSEGLIYCDIVFGDNKFRIFNTHLESPGFGKEDFTEAGSVKPSKNLINKLKNSYNYRNIQANSAAEIIRNSPNPVIVCSDIGDVPNSYAYFKLKGNLRDAFLNKGSGFGRTYRFISPTLRIDYLFVDKKIQVQNFYLPNIGYSDHLPLISDLRFK
ncbi:MAG: endonuclease/exonuclease/phosphatase family protein [Ignavibacterium sp.]|nr:endonuclease/exonuclease/phosphatase family protein [Ignavibacterium sp.]